ncbi:Crp/Fnr family transcriptional regulator [Runella rosea]|uniref:Crp/Fnr family transcriptional regulator n=1 Tax=Runella rosea TaxID=2259595 RepID=A0A344TIA1_9BACT|nr:Crp/Fnr family transcriptional regulator [Runella rosea]AXE18372.1 Crp/Fnr family transcriptional regulator [Runella rosea]
MRQKLINYFAEISSLSHDELAEVMEQLDFRSFEKGTVLIHEGQVHTKCYYIIEGLVRQYSLEDGLEKSIGFFTEYQTVMSIPSITEQKPSKYYFVCLEPVTCIVGDPAEEQEMYAKYPKLETLTRFMIEQDFGQTQEDFANFVTSSPEKRYLNLLQNRPDLLQRVPQHQLASYLGIKPESLSRIRKRITKK